MIEDGVLHSRAKGASLGFWDQINHIINQTPKAGGSIDSMNPYFNTFINIYISECNPHAEIIIKTQPHAPKKPLRLRIKQ